MGDVGLLQFLYAAPLYAVAIAMTALAIRAGPAFWARWNERLRDKARARAGDWSRLRGEIARLDARCAMIEGREEQCRSDLGDAVRRIAELEGYNIGRGEARQEAQRMLSAGRESDAAKRGKATAVSNRGGTT
jgi:hypothetical protein